MASKKNLTEAAQAVTTRFFSGASVDASKTAQEGRQEVQSSKTSTDAQNAVRGRKKSSSEPLKVFSFRSPVNEVDKWRLYASIRGVKVDEIGAAAMREYLKKHPLKEEEQALFDKRVESMNS